MERGVSMGGGKSTAVVVQMIWYHQEVNLWALASDQPNIERVNKFTLRSCCFVICWIASGSINVYPFIRKL